MKTHSEDPLDELHRIREQILDETRGMTHAESIAWLEKATATVHESLGLAEASRPDEVPSRHTTPSAARPGRRR